MADTLTVHLNEESLHSVSAESVSFETTGSFAVVLQNHGSPAHVHLKLDGELAAAASFDASNHFVDANAQRVVRVNVPDGVRPLSGDLTVFTGYGSESTRVPITVREPTETEEGVAVAEELSKKPTPPKESRTAAVGFVPAVVAGTSVLLAAAAFLALDSLVALFVGGVFLLGGLATALFLARQVYS